MTKSFEHVTDDEQPLGISRELLSYLAAAIDCDGSIGIKRNTYGMRKSLTCTCPSFSGRVALHQVTPQIPRLLQATFGGTLTIRKPQTPNSRASHNWHVHSAAAARACRLLLPFLRIKRRRAALVLALAATMKPRFTQIAFWYGVEHPDWRNGDLLTFEEANRRLGYKSPTQVNLSIHNGTLLAIPYQSGQPRPQPRVPRGLVDIYGACLRNSRSGRRAGKPVQLLRWRERLWTRCKQLNKVGINGTPATNRIGVYTPAPDG